LEALEKEEEIREAAGMYNVPKIELDETMQEICRLAKRIRDKKAIIKDEARVNKSCTKAKLPRTSSAKQRDRSVSKLRSQMSELGVEASERENVKLISMQMNVYLLFDVVRLTLNKPASAEGPPLRAQSLSRGCESTLRAEQEACRRLPEMKWVSKILR
jgi:hypothetical protein